MCHNLLCSSFIVFFMLIFPFFLFTLFCFNFFIALSLFSVWFFIALPFSPVFCFCFFLRVSSLSYPNLLGTKGLVVIVVVWTLICEYCFLVEYIVEIVALSFSTLDFAALVILALNCIDTYHKHYLVLLILLQSVRWLHPVRLSQIVISGAY
jgi:hypothetical protein